MKSNLIISILLTFDNWAFHRQLYRLLQKEKELKKLEESKKNDMEAKRNDEMIERQFKKNTEIDYALDDIPDLE